MIVDVAVVTVRDRGTCRRPVISSFRGSSKKQPLMSNHKGDALYFVEVLTGENRETLHQ